jgi:L-lactate dehydrogenase complex protein LldG
MTAGTTGLLERFEREATDAGCEVRRTTADDFDATLAECLETPAVGAPLPFDGVSLPESVVTEPSPGDLGAAATGVTAARFGVADYGSVAVESTPAGEEIASLWPERHVAVLAAGDLVADMESGIERVGEITRESGDVVLATGPSATADMGELVVGAHGPRAVTVVALEDR